METAISIKNVSKVYRITHKVARYVTLRDIISFAILSPFQHAKNQAKRILGRTANEEFWALKDVNLDVRKGEVIGVIGRNGAGKSTLLKILTGITPPTTGEIKLRGKVASLLEVGTGFHPELTGRENIYLNGAILGMTRKEIERKFDQIVSFSGIDQFLDTPVKRYSSGMYVRLAFSVAAHLEPDILLVDEVLAVGDAEFQKKCLGKMDEVTRTNGRTILFVSHNMDAIRRLCRRTIFLDHGKIVAVGNTDKIVDIYLKSVHSESSPVVFPLSDGEVSLQRFSISQDEKDTSHIDGGRPFNISVDFSIAQKLRSFRIGVWLKNASGVLISRSFIQDYDPSLEDIAPGKYRAQIEVPAKLFVPGEYQLELKVFCFGVKMFFPRKSIERSITVQAAKDYNEIPTRSGERGYFILPKPWKTHVVSE